MSPRTKPEQAKLFFTLRQGYISLQKKCFGQNLSARSKAFFHDFQNLLPLNLQSTPTFMLCMCYETKYTPCT